MKNNPIPSIKAVLLIVLVVSLSIAEAAQYNSEVFEAQQKLMALGYDPGPIDGILSRATQNAIKKYQQTIGLTVSGLLDKQKKKSRS